MGPMWILLPSLAAATPHLHRGRAPRPQLSGTPERVESPPFRVHFTRSGQDAVSDRDSEGNGLPDVVDAVVEGLQLGASQFEAEGWRPLMGDDGRGGSADIDVYFTPLDQFGTAYVEPAADGEQGASCFVTVDSDLQLLGDVAQSVALHELHHCVQYRYRVDLPGWLYESAATYEQYSHVTSPVLDVAVGVLFDAELSSPERRLGSTRDRDPYAAFLLMKFWTEFAAEGAQIDRLPALWEDLAIEERWREGLDAAATREFGAPFAELYLRYATWNGFACGGADGQHYLDDPIPCLVDTVVPIEAAQLDVPFDVTHVQSPFTAHYAEIDAMPEGDHELVCEGEGVRAAWLRLGPAGVQLEQSDTPAPLTFRTGDRARAVVVGTDAPLDATCTIRATQEPAAQKGCTTSSGAPGWLALGWGLLWHRRRRR
ncbi:MAG: hypothetical protein KTR31_24780 [Myxococcales bacterium]|nr:hypothetical protein [Myxococcales bacterium]